MERGDPRVRGAQALDARLQHRQQHRRRVRGVQHLELVPQRDGRLVPLESPARGVTLAGQPLRLAGLLEQRPTLGQRPVRLGPPVTGRGQRVAVPLQADETVLPRAEPDLAISDRVLRDLEPSRGHIQTDDLGHAR